MADDKLWFVALTATAVADYEEILDWTAEHFGEIQAFVYAETIDRALADLRIGPSAIGIIRRDDVVAGLCSLHIARKRRKGRHLVLFRITSNEIRRIEVLRILHDAMDIIRHVSGS